MKQNKYKIFIAAFLLLCLLPTLGMLWQGEPKPMANEILSPLPQLREKDGSFHMELLTELSDYYEDRFGGKRELATLWAQLHSGLLHTSVEEKVMLGKEDWLFYSETAADVMGQGLDEGSLSCIANNLALMQEYLQSQGMEFCFVIVPNKASLYPQMLPDHVPDRHDGSNAARLLPMLQERGIVTADLFKAFAGQDVLYYRTDSHWTSQGAALAADTVLQSLGRSSAYYAGGFEPGGEHKGDLYEMLYPTGSFTERDMVSAQTFHFHCKKDPMDGDAIRIETENSSAAGSLFCWRDSFGAALYPYLAESFEKATFSRSTSYKLLDATDREADCVVLELVERNLPQLLQNIAQFPAPRRELPLVQPGSGSVSFRETEKTEELRLLQGRLTDIPMDAGSRLYVLADGEAYEASRTMDTDGTPGFSLWLLPDCENVTALICTYEGKQYAHKLIQEDE